jgi:hypothetical protein
MNETLVQYFGLAVITVFEVIIAFSVSLVVDMFVSITNDDHKNTWHLLAECCVLAAGLMLVFTFIARQLHKIETVKAVKQLTEWKEFPLLFVFGFIFCDVLQSKIESLRHRTGLHGTEKKTAEH